MMVLIGVVINLNLIYHLLNLMVVISFDEENIKYVLDKIYVGKTLEGNSAYDCNHLKLKSKFSTSKKFQMHDL